MKRLIWMIAIGLVAVATLPAQQGGGAPLAWNDANKDGICDVTNQPVGQNPGQGRRMATGQGRAGAMGQAPAQGQPQGLVMGRGRGMARGAAFAPGTWSRGGWSTAGRGRRGGAVWRQPQAGAQTQQAPAAPAPQTPPAVQEQ